MNLEKHITTKIPDQLYKIAAYWEQTRTCVPIKSLPAKLQKAGVDWKYYALKDHWMNGAAGHQARPVHACDLGQGRRTPRTS